MRQTRAIEFSTGLFALLGFAALFFLTTQITNREIRFGESGYRLIGRVLMRAMLESQESGFEFEVEMIARAIALGLPIEWVPVRTIYAGEPSHIEPLRHFREFLRVTVKARRIARGARD